MKRYVSLPLMFIIATWVVAPGWAQAGSGFYLSGDLGLNLSKGVEIQGASNDTWSACDQFLNPDYNSVGARDVGALNLATDLPRTGLAISMADGHSGRSGGGLQLCRSKPEQPLGGSR